MSATVQSRHPLLHYHPRPQGSVSELVSASVVATQQVLVLESAMDSDSELASEPELAVATQQVPGLELGLGLG